MASQASCLIHRNDLISADAQSTNRNWDCAHFEKVSCGILEQSQIECAESLVDSGRH